MHEDLQNADVDGLTRLTYDELRHIAARVLREERGSHTLQPTALVHEAYLKISRQESANWQNKNQFLAVAARCMRRILVDYARNRNRLKRGGARQQVSLDDLTIFSKERSADLIWLDEALTRLSSLDHRQAEIVELRFYGGLSVEETASIMDISPKRVKRDWSVAKAWLYGELREQYEGETGDWEQVTSLFEAALQQKHEDRGDFIDRMSSDPEIRREVARLLENHEDIGSFLSNGGFNLQPLSADSQSPPAFLDGQILAERFKVVGMIARGGIGEVYTALDVEEETLVAIKTIRADLLNTHLLQRFSSACLKSKNM
jgi:RNA polymerase sigma-70 factor (ECF subfamily)